MGNSDPLFRPAGIAVVGASVKEGSPGLRVLSALRRYGYRGELAAVNPRYDEIEGVPCFATLAEVAFPVDLAIMAVPGSRVPDLVAQAVSRGARAAVVFSSGFAESGAAGIGDQKRLAETVAEGGIQLLGPNCQGFADFRAGVVATFSASVARADPETLARIGYVGQSGAVGGVFFDLAQARGITPAVWISTGNELQLSAVHAANRVLDAGPLDLICLYLEQLPDGRSWIELCERAQASGVALAVLRSGRSAAGSRAVTSHTGALIGDDRAFDLVSRSYGVTVADDISDLVEIAVSCARCPVPGGSAIGVVSTSGGAGALAADQIDRTGLTVRTLGAATRESLESILPAFATASNPVDVTADAVLRGEPPLGEVCRIVAQDPSVDQVVLVLTNLDERAGAAAAQSLPPELAVPLTVVNLGDPSRLADVSAQFATRGVPCHESIRAAITALAGRRSAVATSHRPTDHRSGPGTVDLPEGPILTEWGARTLLDWAGIARPRGELAPSPGQVTRIAHRLGSRVALKLQAPELLHKSELGAVRLDIAAQRASDVAAEMVGSVRRSRPDLRLDGILVQQMVPEGVELLVGLRAGEDGYPPVITVGLGGVLVELYRDVATAIAPVDVHTATELLLSLQGAPLLTGFRGRPPADLPAAAEAIAGLSRACRLPNLLEVEINPLIVHAKGEGATAADLLVRQVR